MAEADWTAVGGCLGTGDIDRGVSPLEVPPGGGNYSHAFVTKTTVQGVSALRTNKTGHDPVVGGKGGIVEGVFQRGNYGPVPVTGFSSLMFMCLQTDACTALCYMLGLSSEDPTHIVLGKRQLDTGLPALSPNPTVNGILRRSAVNFSPGQWIHLRLDVIVQPTGDVLLQVFSNDLSINPVGSAPVWQAISGMDDFVDDVLQVATGSAPLTGGFQGFAMRNDGELGRVAFVDQVATPRQV